MVTKAGSVSNRGSEWHKWDLHIHSPKSWLNNQYKRCKNEDFIKTVKGCDLKVIGLTNYFRFADGEIDGDKNLKQMLEEDGIVVFPNLEIRLSFQNKESDLCDYHVLFTPNTPPTKINNFLAQLNVHYGNGETCKSNELTEEQLKGNKLYIDFADLEKVLGDKILGIRDYVLTGFLSDGKGESRSTSVSDHICNNSDFILHSSTSDSKIQKDYEFWTRDTNKPIKPIFQGSDAHCLKDIGKKFTWAKALPTMDGFIQIITNPAERLRFQDGSPNQIKSNSMIIDRIETKDGLVVFNADLTSIIGMRGNGKSILLKAIASMIDPEDFAKKVGSRAESDIKWRKRIFGDGLKVVWADGAENGNTVENPRRIFYLPQGYLSSIAYEENAKEEERRDFLLDLLRKNEKFRNAEKQVQDFIDRNDQDIYQTVNALFKETFAVEQASNENKALGNIDQLDSESKDFDKKIKTLSSKNAISKDEQTRYSVSKAAISSITAKAIILRQDINILSTLKDNQATWTPSIELSGLSDDTKQRIESKAQEAGDKVLGEIIYVEQKELKDVLKETEAELVSHQKTIDELEPKFKGREEITSLIAHKSELDAKIQRVQANESIIKKSKKLIKRYLNELCKKYFLYKQKQADIFKTVEFTELEFLSIELNINEVPKNRFIETYINLKSQGEAENATKDFLNNGQIGNEQILRAIIEDILNDKLGLKKGFINEKKQVIDDLLKNPFQIDFLRSIKTKDGKTNFLDMTGGQKAIAMLELVFTFDANNYPILLDQPEDDIDTSSVSSSIVDFIKKQKEKRQIFIVSHSGSLVVCSDSEEIIVAKNRGDKFTYQTGAIEDESTRKEIIDILEGGKDALELRMRKLRCRV